MKRHELKYCIFWVSSLSFSLDFLLDFIMNFECTVSPLINTAAIPVGATIDIASGLPHEAERYFRASTTLDFPVPASPEMCIRSRFPGSNFNSDLLNESRR